MGFGYLFLGFLFLAKAPYLYIDFLPDFIGFALMFTGIRTARAHSPRFDFSYFACLLGIPLSLFQFGSQIWLSVTGTLPSSVGDGFGFFYEIYLLFFVSVLLYSLYGIAKDTELTKLSRRAALHIALTLLFGGARFVLALLPNLPVALSEDLLVRIPLIASLLSYLWVCLDATVVFSCYMWICLEGDEDMEDNRKHRLKTPFDILESKNTKAQTKKKH